MTLTPKQLQQIASLRSNGLPYKKIAQNLGVSVGSVFNHAKTVMLTGAQKRALEENENRNRRKFASIFAVEKEIKIPVLDADFANLLGHLFFDGSVFYTPKRNRYILNFTNASMDAIQSFLAKMKYCFDLDAPKINKNLGKNISWFQVIINSKKAYLFLRQIAPTFSTPKGARVPNLLKCAAPELKAAFLRAFWDDEGCISNDGCLSGCSASERMIDDLVLLHQEFGIDCHKRVEKADVLKRRPNPRFALVVRGGKMNFQQFIEKVGFEHAIVTKGYHIGRPKKEVLAEKFAELCSRDHRGRNKL